MLEVILARLNDFSEQILMLFPRMCKFPRRILACEGVNAAHHLVQLGARVDRQWSIILSEHIWPFVHGFCFSSRSDKWCAIEPRGEGLGGGVRGQGGAQGAKGASKTLSAADAGHRRHIIALGLIALAQR